MFSQMRTIQRININITLLCVTLARGSIIGLCFFFLSGEYSYNLFFSCLPNVTHAFKLSAFAMVFMASRDIKAGEQLFYSYCSSEQSASKRKTELAPYGIAQCICSSCVNATPETDAIRETYSAQLKEYKRQSLTWERLGKVPAGTIDELLRYQRAVVKEGFDTEDDYWVYFLPVLMKAYRVSGKTRESTRLLQKLLKRRDFLAVKEAIEKSG